MQKIVTHLWFDDQAEEAARFYTKARQASSPAARSVTRVVQRQSCS